MKFKRLFGTVVAFSLVGCMCVSSDPLCTNAKSISELEQEKEETEDKKKEAQGILDQLEGEKDNILAVIKELDEKVANYNAQITDLEAQKADLEIEIEETKEELEVAQAEEQKQYDAMKKRIQYAYENGNVEYLDTVFTSSDVSDMVNKSEYVEQIYNYDSKMLNELVEIRQKVADTQFKLETDLNTVEDIEEEVTESKDAVESMIAGKEIQVKKYNEATDEYETLIAQYQADIDATEAQIDELIRKAEEERRKKQEQGLDVVIYYTGGTFQWPVSSGGTITSTFGPRWGSFHYGLDIACPMGTPILAGEAGVVIASYYSASAGEYIVIDHGNGAATEYMHNSTRLVNVGDVVARGQVIAYSGSTGYSTGPHCHFGLRINGQRIDPLPYLQ